MTKEQVKELREPRPIVLEVCAHCGEAITNTLCTFHCPYDSKLLSDRAIYVAVYKLESVKEKDQ